MIKKIIITLLLGVTIASQASNYHKLKEQTALLQAETHLLNVSEAIYLQGPYSNEFYRALLKQRIKCCNIATAVCEEALKQKLSETERSDFRRHKENVESAMPNYTLELMRLSNY
jgi:hypothetical protein